MLCSRSGDVSEMFSLRQCSASMLIAAKTKQTIAPGSSNGLLPPSFDSHGGWVVAELLFAMTVLV
jgi:hypothetical protein